MELGQGQQELVVERKQLEQLALELGQQGRRMGYVPSCTPRRMGRQRWIYVDQSLRIVLGHGYQPYLRLR